jgi:hypothetical protein
LTLTFNASNQPAVYVPWSEAAALLPKPQQQATT